MPRRLVALFALLVVIAGAYGTACGRGAIVCYGGGRQVGNGCYCARGQSWDGSRCVGTPETGACTQRGAMEVVSPAGSMCYCPDGWVWSDANRTECVACTGGAFAEGDACVCPAGTAWIDNACQAQAQQVVAAPVCPGGSIATAAGCECPAGTVWDGANCAAAVQAGPAPIEIRQRTRQSTTSLTCCVNGAKYTCPDDAAFRACTTLSPNHGCARAGGC